MGNGLCPECGCIMDVDEKEVAMNDDGNYDIVEIEYTCPCCNYSETLYDAE